MNRYCVILLGAMPGAAAESAIWARAAAAFKLDEETFATRVRAVMPVAIRRELDEPAANRALAQLHALEVDARMLPDDAQLAYLQRAGRVCGPLPLSALDQFADDGDRYRLRGEHDWQTWSAAPPGETALAADSERAAVEPDADAEGEEPADQLAPATLGADFAAPIPAIDSDAVMAAASGDAAEDAATAEIAVSAPGNHAEADALQAAAEPPDGLASDAEPAHHWATSEPVSAALTTPEPVAAEPDSPASPAPPPAPSTATATALWIGERAQVFGPYTAEQVRHWLLSNEIDPAAMACPVGSETWLTLHDLFPAEAPLIAPPPPGPPPLAGAPTPVTPVATGAAAANATPAVPTAQQAAVTDPHIVPGVEHYELSEAAAPIATASALSPLDAAADDIAAAADADSYADIAAQHTGAVAAASDATAHASAVATAQPAAAVSNLSMTAPPRVAKSKRKRWTWFGDSSRPPALHWFIVLVMSVVTIGVFALLWASDQAHWVRKIDARSKAGGWMTAAAAAWILGIAAAVVHFLWLPDPRLMWAGWALAGLFAICWLAGYFSMASSIRQYGADKPVAVQMDPATLFVFNILYLQGQMTRIARWQKTGQIGRKAPRAIFWWLLFCVALLALALLAAFTVAGSYRL